MTRAILCLFAVTALSLAQLPKPGGSIGGGGGTIAAHAASHGSGQADAVYISQSQIGDLGQSTPGSELLAEANFATHAKWAVEGVFAWDEQGRLITTSAEGSRETYLTQLNADMVGHLVAGKVYQFVPAYEGTPSNSNYWVCQATSYGEAGQMNTPRFYIVNATMLNDFEPSPPFRATTAMAAANVQLACWTAGTEVKLTGLSLREFKTGGLAPELLRAPTDAPLYVQGDVNLYGATLWADATTRFASWPGLGDMWIGTNPPANYNPLVMSGNTVLAGPGNFNFPLRSVGTYGLSSMISLGGWQHGNFLRDGIESVFIGDVAASRATASMNDICVGEWACGSIHQTGYYRGEANIMIGRKGGFFSPDIGVAPITATAASGTGGLDVGSYHYAVSYIIDGVTTVPSALSGEGEITSTDTSYMDLSDLPVYSGPGASTQKVIWRTKAAGSSNETGWWTLNDARLYQVAIIDSEATTYQDTTPDASLGAEPAATDNALILGSDYPWVLKGGQAMLGNHITDYFLGETPAYTSPGPVIFHTAGGSGTDNAGADMIFAPGQSTGSAAGGSFKIRVAPAGTSSSKWNPLADAVTVASDKSVTLHELSGTGNAYACIDANGKLYRSATACVP